MKSTLKIAIVFALTIFICSEGLALSFFEKPEVIFKKGQRTWVKLKKANKKIAPFSHPQKIDNELMLNVLGSLHYFKPDTFAISGKKGKEFQIFTEEEIQMMAPHLVKAFEKVDEGRWVDFSAYTFRGQIMIGNFRLTDGVMFIKDGKLNVALRNIAIKVSPDQDINSYDPTRGYRAFTKMVAVESQELIADNWVAIDLVNVPVRQIVAPPQPTYQIYAPKLPKPAPVPATPAPAPAVTPAPVAPAPAPAAAPAPDAPKADVKERLLKLQELFDEGIITEEEYNKKREEILEEL